MSMGWPGVAFWGRSTSDSPADRQRGRACFVLNDFERVRTSGQS